ncbi:hypothetical protein [Streptomyces griseosporeus]
MTAADIPTRAVTITVDKEPVTGVPRHTTPNEILRLAGIDPTSHYLVKITGRHQDSFEGRGEESITVHDHEKFVSLSTGPTPTS